MVQKLAILGGKKLSYNPEKHFLWPPKEKNRYTELKKFFYNEKLNIHGYPEIVEKFENKFKKYLGVKYVLSTNSGTSALHAAFHSLGIKKNDKVLAPSLTFHATATPLKSLKAKIIFCGCEKDTGNISVDDIKKILKKEKIKMLVITHLGGHPCEMDQIMKLKKKYKFYLVEDCSHAHESKFNGRKVGTFGDFAIFSMDRNKLLSVGEGGVLVTNKKDLFEKSLLATDFGPRVINGIKKKITKNS